MYNQYDPPDDLKPFVSFFYEMEYSSFDEPLQALLPSGTEVMGWQYAGNWYARFTANANHKEDGFVVPDFYTAGQQVSSYRLTALDVHTGMMGVTLRPGALWQYFGGSVERFTHRITDTGQLFAYRLLEPVVKRFRLAKDTQARLAILVDFYRQLYSGCYWKRSFVDEALALICKTKGSTSVQAICHELTINERYLQRHFKTQIGTTVQQYISIMRFKNVFAAIHARRESQPMELIALIHNYYDQSHFYKEHKKYLGIAPSACVLDKFSRLKIQYQCLEDAG